MGEKQIIKCGFCEEQGLKMNLAMALPDGRIAVRRFDDNDTTVISGQKLEVACGRCGNTVFRREVQEYEGTLSSQWTGLHRVQSGQITGTVWIGSN